MHFNYINFAFYFYAYPKVYKRIKLLANAIRGDFTGKYLKIKTKTIFL